MKKDSEAERGTGLGDGQFLRVCTVLSWALGGRLYSSPSLPLHYSRSRHTLFSSASLSPPGPIEPLTNTSTYLNWCIDPLKYWSIICLIVSLDYSFCTCCQRGKKDLFDCSVFDLMSVQWDVLKEMDYLKIIIYFCVLYICCFEKN